MEACQVFLDPFIMKGLLFQNGRVLYFFEFEKTLNAGRKEESLLVCAE